MTPSATPPAIGAAYLVPAIRATVHAATPLACHNIPPVPTSHDVLSLTPGDRGLLDSPLALSPRLDRPTVAVVRRAGPSPAAPNEVEQRTQHDVGGRTGDEARNAPPRYRERRLVEPPRAPDLASKRERLPKLDPDLRPRLCAP